MILADREIQLAIANKQILIDPPPNEESFSSTSLDLTMHDKGEVWQDMPGEPIQPGAGGYRYGQLARRKTVVDIEGHHMRARSFLLAWTRESITLPPTSRIAARVEGKSSLARLGVGVHVTAPTIHAGFAGQIQLEMYNLGPNEIILDVGMRICQLIFALTFGTPSKGYAGVFANQSATS